MKFTQKNPFCKLKKTHFLWRQRPFYLRNKQLQTWLKNTGWELNHFFSHSLTQALSSTRPLQLTLCMLSARSLSFLCYQSSHLWAGAGFKNWVHPMSVQQTHEFYVKTFSLSDASNKVNWGKKLRYILLSGLFLIIILLCDTVQNKNVLLSEYKEKIFYLKQHTHNEKGGTFCSRIVTIKFPHEPCGLHISFLAFSRMVARLYPCK